MNNEQKKTIKAAQLAALLARLKAGKPLTAAQMEFIESAFPELDPPLPDSQGAAGDGDDDIAANVNQLAKRLGVHRQAIAYHRGRSGSPDTLSVSRWRQYLTIMGKAPTNIRLQNSRDEAGPSFSCDTAFAILFQKLSDALPVAVSASLSEAGVKVSPGCADRVAWNVWTLLAAVYHNTAKAHNAAGPFAPVDNEGRCEYPEEIVKLAGRIDEPVPEEKPTGPPATQEAEQPPTQLPEPPAPPMP
jgi:hypothetical protein